MHVQRGWGFLSEEVVEQSVQVQFVMPAQKQFSVALLSSGFVRMINSRAFSGAGNSVCRYVFELCLWMCLSKVSLEEMCSGNECIAIASVSKG